MAEHRRRCSGHWNGLWVLGSSAQDGEVLLVLTEGWFRVELQRWTVLARRETGRGGRTGWAGKEEEVGCWVGLGFWFSFLFSYSIPISNQTQPI